MTSLLHEPINRRRFIAGSLKTAAVLTALQSGWSPLLETASARELLNERLETDPDDLQSILKRAARTGGDVSEIFLEQTVRREFRMLDDRLTDARYRISEGCGVRVIEGRSIGYAFADGFDRADVRAAAMHARGIARNRGRSPSVPLAKKPTVGGGIIRSIRHLDSIDDAARLNVMQRAIRTARESSNLIEHIEVQYSDEVRRILIADNQGLYRTDTQPLITVQVNVSAADGWRRHQGNRRLSKKCGFELFDDDAVERIAAQAAEEAVQMLAAGDPPAGEIPVILASGTGGVIFHEAVGHGLEGDSIIENGSYYCNRLGDRIGSPLLTLADDGSFQSGRGSAHFDDEGSPTNRTVLIENGVLKTYLTDRISASVLGLPLTGNARRESYREPPLVRMTNTLLDAGRDDPSTILADTPEGLYCKSFNGGMVDTASGHFTFYVREAYEIRNGRISRPIRGATLTGKGADLLMRIDRVGTDFNTFIGTCGKGQWVPVSFGQPTIRISHIVVGGTRI